MGYRPPPIFQPVFDDLTGACNDDRPLRNYYKVFVDGGSGSGKTRMGWEVYQALAETVAKGKRKVSKTHYVPVLQGPDEPTFYAPRDGAPWPDEEKEQKRAHYEKELAKHIVQRMTEEKPVNNEASLHQILRHLLGLQNGERGAIVLHIDEFHRTPQVTKDLLSTVRNFSQMYPDTLILPICTGLYTDPSFDMSDTSPGYVKVHHLSYMSSNQATWDLVRAAASATAKDQVVPLLQTDRFSNCKHDLLRYLVEDLRGWPLAAVALGAALQHSISVIEVRRPAFEAAEREVYRQLKSKYNIATLRKMLGHSEAALLKLTLLTLSPFTVWWVGGNGAARSTNTPSPALPLGLIPLPCSGSRK